MKKDNDTCMYDLEGLPLPFTLQNKIVDFLVSLPNIDESNALRALLYRAGLDSELYHQIHFAGPSAQFFQLLIPMLSRYGTLKDGRNAIRAVLEAAKNSVGQEGKAFCDCLIQELHDFFITREQAVSSQIDDSSHPRIMTSLQEYRHIAHNMLSQLQQLRVYSKRLHLEQTLIDRIDEAIIRIQSNRFSIAVVGEFKRGKSTLINALLGENILPSDVLPTTATINRITYGVIPKAKVLFKDGHAKDIELDQLAQYATRLPEFEATAAHVKSVEISYPSDIFRENIEIIDTPGLNDDITMMEITLSILPTVDVAILVMIPTAPFSMTEQAFLDKLLTHDLGRVLFVVTAIDRIQPENHSRILQSITKRVKKAIVERADRVFGKDTEEYRLYLKKYGAPKVFGLSGWQALQAKRAHDDMLLAASQFPEFMNALEQFLTQERGIIILQGVVDRVIKASLKILEKIGIQHGALSMSNKEFDHAYQHAITEIQLLREKQKDEVTKIQAAISKTVQRVYPWFTDLEDELKRSVAQVIDDMAMSLADLDKTNREAFLEKLSCAILDDIQRVSKMFAEKIQIAIQCELVTEAARLHTSLVSIENALHQIELVFANIYVKRRGANNPAAERFAAALSVSTGFGGIWSGYRYAHGKGAVVRGLTSFGTCFSAGFIVSMLGFPITWPIVIAAGIISIFTDEWLKKEVFGEKIVHNFKKTYKEEIFHEIEQRLQAHPILQMVEEHITNSFEKLKCQVTQELDAVLNQTQRNLDDLYRRREQNEILNVNELAELEAISVEAQKIFNNAWRLNTQLIAMIDV